MNTYVGGDAGNRRDDATVKRRKTTFRLVHLPHGGPHTRELLWSVTKLGKGGRLDGEAGPYNVEGVGEENGGNSSNAAAGQAGKRGQVCTRLLLEEVLLAVS